MLPFQQNFKWIVEKADPVDRIFADIVNLYAGGEENAGDVALWGIPFDAAIRGRPGARMAPPEIRKYLAKLKAYSLATGPVEIPVHDLGDMALVGLTVLRAHELIESAQREIISKGLFPLALGGDHSLTYPLCKPYIDQGKTSAISFDAHLDIREVHGQPCSGSSFGRLMDAGLDKLVVIGVRDFANSSYHINKANSRKTDVHIIPAYELSLRSADAIVEEAIAFCRSSENIYLSIDMDVADQSKAPGVSAPTAGGLSIREIMVGVRLLCQHKKVKAVDICEVSPPLDERDQTIRAAATILASALAGLGSR